MTADAREVVARAISDAFSDPGEPSRWDKIDNANRDTYRQFAKSGLAALRAHLARVVPEDQHKDTDHPDWRQRKYGYNAARDAMLEALCDE